MHNPSWFDEVREWWYWKWRKLRAMYAPPAMILSNAEHHRQWRINRSNYKEKTRLV